MLRLSAMIFSSGHKGPWDVAWSHFGFYPPKRKLEVPLRVFILRAWRLQVSGASWKGVRTNGYFLQLLPPSSMLLNPASHCCALVSLILCNSELSARICNSMALELLLEEVSLLQQSKFLTLNPKVWLYTFPKLT